MDPEDKDFMDAVSYQPNISKLKLGKKIGYTYRALSAAIWALRFAESYKHGVLAIINRGGDADTNACVAGALLGAKWGFKSIPSRWIDGLVRGKELMAFAEKFIAEMERRADRRAIGLNKESTGTKESQTSESGERVFMLFDGDVTADEILSAIKEHTK